MSFLSFFLGTPKKSALLAKDRLKIILAQERSEGSIDYLPQLQKELIEVISKYIKVNPEDIKVNLERDGSLDILEVKIEMNQIK
ncbi:Cell division topological specificity factor [Candidatus Kinetoplastibacterium sorsogonicusi]|uniref:Cell division topological specificity factor n=1 Tax=Candidatus Kinetoplastidibacterium kentomonadis TaxID=1576550 RepID=A0A3S7JAD0_9PROT|nr:cell division topological specificity factor MinE [Candidatus Kinetoplastibacterium sorsogonicusi]AWD32635.1 Cell division topological specificity factor [Candidatus Kinetoplastibacterium sorsogonicusi]